MNKIYRRLWSTARQCWVVASELTSPRGKAASTAAATSAVLLSALLPGVGLDAAHATIYDSCQSPTQIIVNCVPYRGHDDRGKSSIGSNSGRFLMQGAGSHIQGYHSALYGSGAVSAGDYNAVFGNETIVSQGYSAVFGAKAQSNGIGTVSVGHYARSYGTNSIAIGSGAQTVSGAGISRVAIGGNAFAGTDGWTGGTAIGGESRAEFDGTAIGYEAKATKVGAVAIGRGSVANEGNTVSVGSSSTKRRVVNVADGNVNASSYDAVNGRQLQGVKDTVSSVQRVANSAQSIATAAKSTADQALVNTRLVTQTSAGSIIRVGGDNTGNVLTVSNKNGEARYLNGVRNATLSATSTDAVTGQQLFATNQRADAAARVTATGNTIAEENKASATGSLSLAMGQVAKANGVAAMAFGHGAIAEAGNAIAIGSASGASGTFAVAVGGNAKATHENSVALGEKSVTTGAKQVSVGNATMKRKIVNMDDGAINATSSEAVTGKQMYQESQRVNGLVKQASAGGIMYLGAENTGNVLTVSNKDGGKRYVNGVQNAALSASSSDAVTGQQLFATNNNVATAQNTANNALGKANALGGLVSQAAADGNVRLGGENTGGVLDVRNKANANRTLSGLKDGAVSATSTEAVTGKQLNTTNTEVASVRTVATAAQTTANTAKTTADSALGKANTLGGLVSQIAADGNVRLGGENTGAVLDVRNKSNASRTLSGVKDGALNATSTEAVTGKQLNTTNTEVASVRTVATAAQTTANTAKTTADNALGKANTLGGLVSQVAADGNVRLGGENTGAMLDVRNKSNANRTLSGLRDGAVNGSSTEAVTGKQLFATNEKVQANEGVLAGHTSDLTAQSGRIADNRRDLDALRSDFEGFDPDLDGVVKFAADGSVDIAGGKLRGVAAGDISSAASTDAVNGGQLFATNERISSMEYGGRFFKVGTDEYSEDAYAGWFGVAIGESAEASRMGEGGVAVGGYARALATNSVALGRGSTVMQDATKGFALGAGSRVDAEGGVAFGADSKVMSAARGSVAIGEGSIADVAGTVSLGGEGLVRRITNVGRGLGLSDASTVAQLDDALRTLGAGAGMDGNGNIIAPTYNVQGGTQNNVGDALAALDSAVVTADSRVDNLEGKLRSAFQDSPSVRADGLNQLVLAGANGSVLTNLADGRIAAGSRDAVTGSQLFEAKQEIARNRSDLNDLRGQRDGLLSRGLMVAGQGNLIDYGGARLTGVADGVVSPRSNDVVVGSQLYASNERIGAVEGKMRNFAFGVTPYEDEDSDPPMAGKFGVSIGDWSKASPDSEGAVAVGFAAVASGKNSVALGRGSHVHKSAERGFAVGTESQVGAFGGIALGAASVVGASAFNAVALGAESIAEEANTISVGHRGLQRRIVNVANGRNATDAATVGQLRGALATLGGDVDANGNIINPTFNVQGGQQSTLNEALSTLDSAVATNTIRTERVETQLRAVFQDSPSVRNDGLNQLTFAGANGMVLSNVANGAIAAGSRDAVNGGQLHSMQQQLNGRMDGLEQRIDGQPQAPQSRSLTVAAAGGSTASSTPAATPADDEPTAPPPSTGDNKVVADAGNAPKSSPQPQADAPKPESPTPQVDTAELEKMLARANEYSDGISREVDRRLDKMDKRFNRMAAMTSAQSAMAMNTAGLNTYNRLGAGVGYSEGESAMAVGYQRVLNDKGSATFSLNGAFTNSGERSMGVGVGIGW
ncbi:ESPR-type extended signal peptide-containing protein [Stenotrophomonas maltophilia]|uniref:ESPR-type extended signal peptide-containing protein n=1 Tax=Stenotrophomonas maltophilia TaxID=40324 RepID=UPI000DA719E4|nr:ESPR-type extended signal peptide-containing protein [Stenotrophomonas maltophilia]